MRSILHGTGRWPAAVVGWRTGVVQPSLFAPRGVAGESVGRGTGGVEVVVLLLPANRCEQRWWQDYVEPFRDKGPLGGISCTTRFLRGRTKFSGVKQGFTKSPPFGCVIVTIRRET